MAGSSARVAAAVLTATVLATGSASAYVGASFMEVPGIAGGWAGDKHKNWTRVESHLWKTRPVQQGAGGRAGGRAGRAGQVFSIPNIPRQGAGSIAIAIDKRSPAVAPLLEKCLQNAKLPEITYAELAEDTRPTGEFGLRPAEVPEYFEYTLKDVQLTCSVVADAPEQAFILEFQDIAWLNYKDERDAIPVAFAPNELPALKTSGTNKSFVVTWFGVAHDVDDAQCPVMNTKPPEDYYYALMTSAAAAKERVELAPKGGVNYNNRQISLRGPNKLSVCLLPGIVTDKSHAAPQTKVARGLNLDGDDGTGNPSAGTCKHANYMGADGRKGIDNQLYTVLGCVPAYMGHKGFYYQYKNEGRRNSRGAALIEVNGIDNDQNDDSVFVTVLYSKDPMQKDGSGAHVLHDYTFRLSDDVETTRHFVRLAGRIENGVVITEQVPELQVRLGGSGLPDVFYNGAIRLEFMPDGSMKGVVAGYQKWRDIYTVSALSEEGLYGFRCPAMYDAYKKAADGLKDPVTGECDGISAAYDIEGVPAFIPPAQRKALIAENR